MKKLVGILIGIAAFAAGALVVNAFQHKITLGNLIGLRVSNIVLVDTAVQKAFDADGKSISMDNPYISDFKDPRRKDRVFQRKMVFTLPGAKSAQVRFLNMPSTGTSSLDGRYEVGFPVENTSNSIPYQIEATADGWEAIDTWTQQSPSRNITVEERPDAMLVEGKKLPSVSIGAKNLPFNDPQDLGEDFKIECDPNPDSHSEWSSNIHHSEQSIWKSVQGHIADIERITVYRRSYHIVSSGVLAFGAKGDRAKTLNPSHEVKLVSVSSPAESNPGSGIQWTPEGKKIPFQYYSGGYISTDSSYLPKRHESPKFLVFRFLVGEIEPGLTLRSSTKFAHAGTLGGPTGRFVDGMEECFLATEAVNPPAKTDLDLLVANGPFIEVARSTISSSAKMGSEPVGSYVVQKQPGKHDSGSSYYYLRIPKEFKDAEFQVNWIDRAGKAHEFGGYSNTDSHVGIGPINSFQDATEIAGLIVKARKFKHFPFKNIQLQPTSDSIKFAKR